MSVYRQISPKRRMITTTLFVFVSLTVFALLPEGQSSVARMQSVIASIIFFLVLPMMYCKIVLREPLTALGLKKVNWIPAFFWGGVMLAVGGVLILFFLSQDGFKEAYQLPQLAERNFFWFIAYEVVVVGGVTLLYEVFFRGLIMHMWLKSFGARAIVLQSILFIGFTWLTSGISWQYALLLYASFFSGACAYFSGSIYASWLISWLFFFLVDIVFLLLR